MKVSYVWSVWIHRRMMSIFRSHWRRRVSNGFDFGRGRTFENGCRPLLILAVHDLLMLGGLRLDAACRRFRMGDICDASMAAGNKFKDRL